LDGLAYGIAVFRGREGKGQAEQDWEARLHGGRR
jgi:hypothetical protein